LLDWLIWAGQSNSAKSSRPPANCPMVTMLYAKSALLFSEE
jgi:hypothetical protein